MKVTTEYTLSERFEVAFNQIHESLKKMIKINTDKFSALVRHGSKHKVISTFHEELYQYSKLRNALVHDKTKLGFYIAEPHPEVVARIERIADILSKPNYALTIATRNVICFDYEDSIEYVVRQMRIHSYAQYPIYQNKACIGLLTASALVKWMADHVVNSVVDLSNYQIKDILEYEKDHPVAFARKSINIFEIEDLYENYHQNGDDLEAVIITENGKKDEAPLGVVTAWDLIEIDYKAE